MIKTEEKMINSWNEYYQCCFILNNKIEKKDGKIKNWVFNSILILNLKIYAMILIVFNKNILSEPYCD